MCSIISITGKKVIVKRCKIEVLIPAMITLVFAQNTPNSPVTVKPVRNPFSAPAKTVLISNFIIGHNEQNLDNVRWEYIPRIQLTGVMSVKGKQVACANIEGVGNLILKEGDRVVIPNKTGTKSEVAHSRSAWVYIRAIGDDKIEIQLDDGTIVSGSQF